MMNSRSMQSGEDRRDTTPGRTPRDRAAAFIDNRLEGVRQRRLAESIYGSPYMTAQRAQLSSAFGALAQLEEDEEEEAPESYESPPESYSTGQGELQRGDDGGNEGRISASISLSSSPAPEARGTVRSDAAVSSAMAYNLASTNGVAGLGGGDSFGATTPTHNTTLNSATRQEDGSVRLDLRHDLSIDISLKAPDASEIADENSGNFTNVTWINAYKDLYPNSYGKPLRQTYWNQKIVDVHEKVHKSDSERSTGAGINAVVAWLNKQTLPTGKKGKWRDKMKKVRTLVNEANTRIRNADLDDYFGSSSRATPHDQRAGEQRAYASGKTLYQNLANKIRALARRSGWNYVDQAQAQKVKEHHRNSGHPE